MNTKALFLSGALLLIASEVNAQEGQDMAYKFGYLFKKNNIKDNGHLYLVKKDKEVHTTVVGHFALPHISDSVTIINSDSVKHYNYVSKEISKKLKGTVVERNEDTLSVKFWNITNHDPKKGRSDIVNIDDNNKEFIYVINKWKNGRSFDLPFRFKQFMATSLPFRVLTKTGKLESDFLNANVAFLFVSGKTRLFNSEFIKPRNRYFAWGPYLGLSSIDNTETNKKEFGINYGVNIVGALQGFNITVAYGFQNGFNKATKEVQPYLGFGIGFKLLETFTPDIKNKDE